MGEFETRTFGDVVCIQGDCISVLSRLTSIQANALCADLPYSVTVNRWDKAVALKEMWRVIDLSVQRQGAKIFFAQQPFTTSLINSANHRFRYDLVWQKNRYSGFVNAKRAPLRSHETLLIFDARSVFNPQKTYVEKTRTIIRASKGNRKNTGLPSRECLLTNYRNPLSILPFKRDDKRDGSGHPTQKPVALLEWLINTYTNPGDLILDPTAGSGTTGVAALNLGRRAVLIEKDPTYFEVMCKRIAEHQAKLAAKA